jgi:hypothetical protein
MRKDGRVGVLGSGLCPVLGEFQARVLKGVAERTLQHAQTQLEVLGVGAPAPRELELRAVRPEVEQTRVPEGSVHDGGAPPVVHRRRELIPVPEEREPDAKNVQIL